MPITTLTCQWCHTRLWPAPTGRPARFCGPTCRKAAHRATLLADQYPEPWQRRALKEGWRPPTNPR